jgi:hypothetical protein
VTVADDGTLPRSAPRRWRPSGRSTRWRWSRTRRT